LQTRSWESQDGQKRYRTEVVAYHLIDPATTPELALASAAAAGADDEVPPF
jgi:single-stranded DNA-binding protein